MSTRTHSWEYTDLGGGATAQFAAADCRKMWRQERRLHHSFTAAGEKRILTWMAERLPAWVNSDHLTALGAAGMVLAGASYALTRWSELGLPLAIVFLALNWLGDSLDGTLARVRNQQRPRYGFYVDHVVDSVGATCLMGGLALSGYAHPAVAIGMLVAFLLLSCELYLAAHALSEFALSFWKFGPTEIRILLAIGTVRLMFSPDAHLFGHKFLLFDVGGAIAIASMLGVFVVQAVRHTVQLYREESL